MVDAFNMCEDYFLGARLADEKEGWVNILEAEKYVTEVAPVKSYLEHACGACFDEAQIRQDIKRMYFPGVVSIKILSSWKQHMSEFNSWLKEQYTRNTIGAIILCFKS